VDVFLTGTAPRALTPAAFAIGLETAVNNVLADAGIDASVSVVLTPSGFLNITTTTDLELSFARPVVVDTPVGTRITLLTPGTTFTLDADTTPLTITRVLQINLRFSNPAYQELGLTTTGCRRRRRGFPTTSSSRSTSPLAESPTACRCSSRPTRRGSASTT
jgi:hypothetical protein